MECGGRVTHGPSRAAPCGVAVCTGWAARRGACRVAGPFPRGLPPNHAGAFQRTWLSSDLRRAVGRVPVDGVVAGWADREGLAPHLCHFRRPGGLRSEERRVGKEG